MFVSKTFFTFLFYSFLSFGISSNISAQERIDSLTSPNNSLITKTNWNIIDVLSYIESFLLQVILPLIVVGVFLYVAFELLTAEGNEEKMKKAWKVVTFSSIGLITIALAYAIIAMASRLSF